MSDDNWGSTSESDRRYHEKVNRILAEGRYRWVNELIAKALVGGVVDGATHLRLLAWIDEPGTREALGLPPVGKEHSWSREVD